MFKGNKFNRFDIFLVSIALIACISFNLINKSPIPKLVISQQDRSLNLNSSFLRFFNLGQKRLIADLLWIHTWIFADTQHYKDKSLGNWLYLRFNSMIVLDPNFYEAYARGAQYLSIIIDDDLGAKDLYDKGLKKFPDDYQLLINAAYHYRFELNDEKTASIIYDKMRDRIKRGQQVPSYVLSYIAKLSQSRGDFEEALDILLINYKNIPDGSRLKPIFAKKISQIKGQRDLKCLNGKQENKKCDHLDFFGRPYQKSMNGKYIMIKE